MPVLVPGGPSSSPNAFRCGLLKSHTRVLPGLCHSDLDAFGDGDARVLADQVHLRLARGCGEGEVGRGVGPRSVLYEDHLPVSWIEAA